jgi:hypothetical protein
MTGFHPGTYGCLPKALVTSFLSRGHGLPARLVVGATAERGFAAHAWVEDENGNAVPRGSETYHPIWTSGAESRP